MGLQSSFLQKQHCVLKAVAWSTGFYDAWWLRKLASYRTDNSLEIMQTQDVESTETRVYFSLCLNVCDNLTSLYGRP